MGVCRTQRKPNRKLFQTIYGRKEDTEEPGECYSKTVTRLGDCENESFCLMGTESQSGWMETFWRRMAVTAVQHGESIYAAELYTRNGEFLLVIFTTIKTVMK